MFVLLRRCLFIFLFPFIAAAQITTGSIGGTVKTIKGEALMGATVKAVHEPTGTMYFSTAGKTGNFFIQNLLPGGPYTVEISFINFITEKKKDIGITLGENNLPDCILVPDHSLLKQVTVSTVKKTTDFTRHTATRITQDKIDMLPATGRNVYEYLRAVPQLVTIQGNEGALSIAGQNNRYNAFYIDGAVNNDVFGLAASGTNGGQAGTSVLSLDAIEQFQVSVSPYDASLGNFTGAAINAVTRAGSNRPESSVYHFFSNQHMAGKSPDNNSSFATATYGLRNQGAILTNRLFYFINIELQREKTTQAFSFADYKGNTKDISLLQILSGTLKGTYHYDPGNFLSNYESLNADRIVMRVDWNINKRNSLSVSNRYTYAQKMNTNASDPNTIHFSNDGYALFSTTNAISVELKSRTGPHAANKLLVTYTAVKDDREPLQRAFPRVRINDGDGAMIFGTDNSSTINLLTQKNWTLFDKYTYMFGKHTVSMGVDVEYNSIYNAFIQNSFGNYTFFSLGDFLTGSRPSAYQLGFPTTDKVNSDHTSAAAEFSVVKTAAFFNHEMRHQQLVLSYGIRADQHHFLNTPATDDYTNTIALPAFAQYRNLENARSGEKIKIPLCISPRLGFTYRFQKQKITMHGGIGLFSGRLPLAWPGGVYTNNGTSVAGFAATVAQLPAIRFRPDPYQQWTAAELKATTNKEPLNLITETLRMPALLRTSLGIDKKMDNGWAAGIECMFSKNLAEIKYTNINLLPPVNNATGADNRSIYSAVNNGKIPLNPDGSNPYDYVILLGNNKTKTGYAYDLTFTVSGYLQNNWGLEMNYHFGRSIVNNDGTSSINVSQWRTMETVNGRNFITPSVSDFSAGHKLFILLNKTFHHPAKSMKTMVSFVYTGQSGSPVSYVYGNYSMTRDDGFFGGYDLLYIPTANELREMIFLPNTVNGILYSSQQQKDLFENYIGQDAYLRSHRGRYAERNGSRTASAHIIDLKIKHTVRIKKYEVAFTCNLFNFTNLLNNNWGRRYYEPNDHIALLDFAGYTGSNNFIPQFRFNPAFIEKPKWSTGNSHLPAYSSNWRIQLGSRITF